jgi:hypothetical protein
VEVGGVIAGEEINGNITGSKVIFTAKNIDYEGQFTS